MANKQTAFALYNGKAWWDKAGVANTTKYYYFGGQRHPAGFRVWQNGVLWYLHGDHPSTSSGQA
ncbi:MAG: hypothetical protein R2932_22045 [Caldilineaceae bacterium]